MKRKQMDTQPQQRLTLKKETLRDLHPKETVLGGFIMKDSIIVRTSSR